MDLFNDLTKGDGCGPQQGALGGMAAQLLRRQQQGGGGGGGGGGGAAAAHMGAPSAQWRQQMHQNMHGPQMGGAGPMDARFQGAPPPMMRDMSMPAAAQARPLSMPAGNWTEDFRQQQQQQMAMTLGDAMQMRSQMSQQQQMMMQRQQMMMMQRQQMMMLQRAQMPSMMGAMGPMMHHQAPPQMAASPGSPHLQMLRPQQAPAAEAQDQQQAGAKEASAEGGAAAAAEAAAEAEAATRDPTLQSEAYRRMEEAWASVQRGEGPIDSLWEEMMAMHGLDQREGGAAAGRPLYNFQPDNKFLSPDTKAQEAFAEGMRLFKAGIINDALLVFEAVVQLEAEHAEAWRMLGQCHADHDEDQKAIVCLERSAECDAYNLPTLLALGVCYVNELDHERALSNLKAWVEHNPDFIGLEVKKDPYSDGSLVDEVMNLMLQVQEHDPRNADVQEVLGVLYNVSKDYNHAIEAFKKALAVRPDDYALWNKLGATQANSDRSEEAMPAYHRALELKPRYARGLLNLGISHSNIGSFEEAMRHYLSALALNPKGHHIWSFIRNSARALGRMDLVHKANMRDLGAFQTEFDIPFLEQQGPPVDALQ